MGIEHKLVEKSGAWLSYGDLRIGQGRENAKQFLKDNPDLAAEIETKLRKALGIASGGADAALGTAIPPEAEPEPVKEKPRRPGVSPSA